MTMTWQSEMESVTYLVNNSEGDNWIVEGQRGDRQQMDYRISGLPNVGPFGSFISALAYLKKMAGGQ